MILGMICAKLVRGDEVELLWIETLMIVLAHYFSTRRFLNLPSSVLRQLEAQGRVEREFQPLYLPRHTIRLLILASLAGVAVYLYRQDRLFDTQAASILGTVLAYLVGNMVRRLVEWMGKGRPGPALRLWQDAVAIAVLGVMGYVTLAFAIQQPSLVPEPLRTAAVGLVLFYFGSR
jgi:hypothetical protein